MRSSSADCYLTNWFIVCSQYSLRRCCCCFFSLTLLRQSMIGYFFLSFLKCYGISFVYLGTGKNQFSLNKWSLSPFVTIFVSSLQIVLGSISPAVFLLSRSLFSSVPPCYIHSGNCPLLRRFFRWLARHARTSSFWARILESYLVRETFHLKIFLITAFPLDLRFIFLQTWDLVALRVESHSIRTCLIYCGSLVVAFDHACPTVSVPCWRSHVVHWGTISCQS